MFSLQCAVLYHNTSETWIRMNFLMQIKTILNFLRLKFTTKKMPKKSFPQLDLFKMVPKSQLSILVQIRILVSVFNYLVRTNITITKVVWPIVTLTIVYFKEEPVVLPLKFWGPTSSECVTAFHSRCRLGRGRHNVEILRQGFSHFLKERFGLQFV